MKKSDKSNNQRQINFRSSIRKRGLKRREFILTDEEHLLIKLYLLKIREA